MGLMANRAATRMQTRQMYRTASRMQRRRSWTESRMGARQDFEPAEEPGANEPAPAAPARPAYVAELEQLAQLRDQGVLSPQEFDAKKRQLLGI
jgi:Short C-terminal domain